MRHLGNAWPCVREALEGKRVMLFLDYDGTLTPIVPHPEDARISVAQRRILKTLAEKGFHVVIVSGRQLQDVKQKVGVPELIYVGNHGFEVEGPEIKHVHPEAEALRQLFKKLAAELKKALADIPGIQVENKIFTLSIHYRNARPQDAPQAMSLFVKVLDPYIRRSQVLITEGKKVWEVRPAVPWDKAKMVLWLLTRMQVHAGRPVAAVYIGDDRTDEPAFQSLKKNGITVRVTDNPGQPTAADYFLLSPQEVYEFLKRIQKMKSRKSYANASQSG